MAVTAMPRTLAIGRMTKPVQARRRGFTLVELMVVLVLIAVLSGVIVAEMKGTFEDALLRSTARELMSVCALASSRSITTLQPHTVVIEPREGRYAIERMVRDEELGSVARTMRDVHGGEGQLDERITVTVRDPARPVEEEDAGRTDAKADEPARPGAITFYADGTADAREISLMDRAGFELKLQVNPITSRVRVVDPLEP